jgi:hypothetical protein
MMRKIQSRAPRRSSEIADEEDAGAEAVDFRRQAEVPVHCQRRETDIHAVEKIRDVEHAEKRNQPPRGFGEHGVGGGQCAVSQYCRRGPLYEPAAKWLRLTNINKFRGGLS